MKRLWIFWLAHCCASVAGWYTLSALAQGVADSTASVSLPLVVLNAVIQLLSFPVLLSAVAIWPWIGGFDWLSFGAFVLLAALNSALVIAAVGLLWRALGGRRHSKS